MGAKYGYECIPKAPSIGDAGTAGLGLGMLCVGVSADRKHHRVAMRAQLVRACLCGGGEEKKVGLGVLCVGVSAYGKFATGREASNRGGTCIAGGYGWVWVWVWGGEGGGAEMAAIEKGIKVKAWVNGVHARLVAPKCGCNGSRAFPRQGLFLILVPSRLATKL
eukprot:scaffold23353_cov20-Tisochrysis_lutea.AAC.1